MASKKTKVVQFPEQPSKQQLITMLIWAKLCYRRNKRELDAVRDLIWMAERKIRKMQAEDSPFNAQRVKSARKQIESIEQHLKPWTDRKHELAEIMSKTMIWLDGEGTTVTERAALLSINHALLERFVADEWPGKRGKGGDLFSLAFAHAECAGESEDFIGDSGNRDHPLFDACMHRMQAMMEDRPDIAEEANARIFDLLIMAKEPHLKLVKTQPELNQ